MVGDTSIFVADTADDVWTKVAGAFRARVAEPLQPSRGGPTREILGAWLIVRDPTQRWVVSRTPSINPAFAIAEVVWLLNGRSDAAFVNHWNPALPRFAGVAEAYHGAYGHRLRRGFGTDQLDRAFQALGQNSDSRQIVLQIWDPGRDMPQTDGEPSAEDIPCNICSLLKVRNGRLEWTQIMRSNDFFRGLPHNIVQFTSLQEIMAGWLGLELGVYRHYADSLHLYSENVGSVERSHPMRTAPNTGSLKLRKPESAYAFAQLAERMEIMVKDAVSETEMPALVRLDGLRSYEDMLRVVGADHARRRGWHEVASTLMKSCQNQALLQLWERWKSRHGDDEQDR